jgi:hypothetical protein
VKADGPGRTAPGEAGIAVVNLYMDLMPGQPGYDPNVNSLATTLDAVEPLVNNVAPKPGPNPQFAPDYPVITRDYGPGYEYAGWIAFWNTSTVQPDMFHTLYAAATSSISGKTSIASVPVYVKKSADHGPACSQTDVFYFHKPCSTLFG